MMIRLEESKNLEAEERARLEEEINSKKSEVEEIVSEVLRETQVLNNPEEERQTLMGRSVHLLMAPSPTSSTWSLQVGTGQPGYRKVYFLGIIIDLSSMFSPVSVPT